MFTILTFLLFTGLVGLITWFMTRKDDHSTSAGYFLAGRTLTGGFIAGSLLLTNLSTEQLIGLNGAAFNDGLVVIAWEVVAGASLVLMALYFLPKYLRSGIATIPQFLEERFNGGTRVITSGIFIIAYAGILLPIILYTGATGLMGILNLNEITGIQDDKALLTMVVWFIGIVGSIYAIFGGLRTVAVSDTLNGIGLLLGGILITVLGLQAMSDGGIFAALGELREAHPEKFNTIGTPDQSVPFGTLFTGVLLLNLFYWTTNQQIIQRTFGASSLKEGQKGVLIAGVFKILAPIILVIPGIIAFHLYGEREGFRSDDAYGTLVGDVLPPVLRGFFAAVVVGAILSSFNSALNSTATLFSLGVYRHIVSHDKASDAQVINVGKIVGGLIAVLSMIMAPAFMDAGSIFGVLQKLNGLYFIPIFAVVLVGLIHRRVSGSAANIALLAGFSLVAVGYFVVPSIAASFGEDGGGFIGGFFRGWVNLNEFHFLGIVFGLLVAFMLIMGTVAPTQTPWVHHHSGDVDLTPWRFAWPVGIGLVVIVLAVYIYFADFSVLAQS